MCLFPFTLFAQSKTKTVQNKSVKVVMEWTSRESGFMCKVYNLNKCDSQLEADFGSGTFAIPIKTKQNDYENVLLLPEKTLRVRNTTTCGGTTEWLIIKAPPKP